jgi:hypothetical protein
VLRKLALAEWAYLAGILDGEGCLTVQKIHKSYQFRVSISNTNTQLIAFLSELFVAKPLPSNKHQKHPFWKQLYAVNIPRCDVIPFLEGVMPFLIVKKEVAELVLDLAYSRTTRRYKWFNQHELALVHQIRNSNARKGPRRNFIA